MVAAIAAKGSESVAVARLGETGVVGAVSALVAT